MNKVLITGGAGYLGSTLAEHLLDNGYSVTVLDNLNFKQLSLLHLFKRDNFKFHLGDVCNTELLLKLVNKNDVIIPLAAIVGMPACKANPELAVKLHPTNSILFFIILFEQDHGHYDCLGYKTHADCDYIQHVL